LEIPGPPVALFICINPSVQVKSIKPDALLANRDRYEARTDFLVKDVAVHAEVARSILQANDAWLDHPDRLNRMRDGYPRLDLPNLFLTITFTT
jgi:hypothetical protein